ncbi:MAG TPA: hypothetical protein VHA10_01125 [Hypericibacter adhaerens]|jgi:hypothetical protein|uniref:Lipoprotein n=1 Tax=Hypericibacter adhaerens TaxID=2602016 RepID=A0A5J6N120_9PROT|nr:hypothetical protein [Hypericibacter adhaerens]QEX20596.1 hypothetical protein FRZ61_05130 [Hypericibacter adhaerens]HWA41783.1 hypothetical protein [Hypericibacter adhaerens]
MQKIVTAFFLLSLASGIGACAADSSFTDREPAPIAHRHGPDSGSKR